MSRDMFGYPADVVAPHLIEGMFSPVKCAFCSGVYDLGKVEVTGRYVDCSVWRTPCCKNTADDRGDTGWKRNKDYYKIDRVTGQVQR